MQTTHQVSALREQIRAWREKGMRIALVPTMGNLHEGHLTLVKQAQQQADRVVVTVFVNPTQFGPGEDYDSYPRTLEQDKTKLAEVGANLLFAPAVEELYPRNIDPSEWVKVIVPGISDLLCGASRPGHFSGVATIVSKLFNLVQPDVAVFGEKDYQQLMVIRRFTEELCFPIDIVGVSTVREADGLAMSSRNGYLSEAERAIAPTLYETLQWVATQTSETSDLSELEQQAVARLEQAGFKVDYLHIRDADTLSEPTIESSRLIVLAAAFLGKPRLIDNLVFQR